MTKFEEFEKELGTAVEGILPGAKCAKISVTFIDEDNTTCTIDITREGYGERLADTDNDALEIEVEGCPCGDVDCVHGR